MILNALKNAFSPEFIQHKVNQLGYAPNFLGMANRMMSSITINRVKEDD